MRARGARRAMGETSYTRGAGGARESVGSAEARVRPSKCPSSALAARARATGNIGFIVRKGRPGKKYSRSTTRNLSRKGIYCAHGHLRQVVARLKAVRAVQGHRGGERSARIARSTQATASHAHDERRTAIQGSLVSYELLQIAYSI